MNKLPRIEKSLLLLACLSLGFLPLALLNDRPAIARCELGDTACNPTPFNNGSRIGLYPQSYQS